MYRSTRPGVQYDCKRTPIDKNAEIRLLEIDPAQWSTSRISCHMTVHSRDASPVYEALSYTWGDSNDPENIQCSAQALSVTKNCANALRALRERNAASSPFSRPPRYVWIDAICINQGDISEKSAQIANMGSIFLNAKRTVVYLGEIDKHAKWMLKYVLTDEDRTCPTRSLKDRAEHWKAFFSRPWFSRTWIIQEVMNSRAELVVLLGSQEIPWSTLEAANTQIGSLFKHDYIFVRESGIRIPRIVSLRDKLSDMIEDPNKEDGFGERITRYITTPLDGSLDTDGVIKTSNRGITYSQLLYVLDHTLDFRCRDGRDKVFAILPLFQTPIPSWLCPDYAKTVDEVYTDLTWYFINHNVCSVVQFIRNPKHDESLPSWVIDWRSDFPQYVQSLLMEPIDPPDWQNLFKLPDRKLYARREGRTLILRGMAVDTIDTCKPKDWTVRWKNGTDHRVTAPNQVKPDDSIVFCIGFPYPFVLQQKADGDWQMICTCYLGYPEEYDYGWNNDWRHYAAEVQNTSISLLGEFRIS